MARKIIVYGTPVASRPARNLCAILSKSDIPYRYIDIQQDAKASERVAKINSGQASVPTVVFRDGSTMTKPSNKQFIARLEEAGHTVKKPSLYDRFSSFFANPIIGVLGVADVVLGSAMSIQNLVYLGFAIVALNIVFGRIIPYIQKRRKKS